MSGSKKFSISLPEQLAKDARPYVGPEGFSSYVAEALEQRVALDKLGEIVADFERRHDPLTQEEREEARAKLHRAFGKAQGRAA
jgi:hypothetical protein